MKKKIKYRINIGDRVELLDAPIMHCFKHRKKPITGRIKNIDGGYIDVKPSWCNWIMEVYDNEIKVLTK